MEKSKKMALLEARRQKILPLLILLLGVFLVVLPTVTAFDFDNVKEEVGLTANGSLEFDGRYIPNNNLWNKYKPLDIKNAFGLGSTLFRGYIDKHTESCSNNCESKIVVKLYSNGVLFDSIKFKRLVENEWIDTSVPYAIFIKVGEENITELEYETECDENGEFWGNGTEKVTCVTYLKGNKTDQRDIWTSYNLGDELAAGTYKVKIVGLKPREETVDWIITSQGKEITEWALWGSAALVLEETPSLGLSSSVSTTDTDRGIKIKPFVNMTLVNITRYAGVTGTNCSIYSEANGFLKNGTFVGEQCTLNYNLVANTIYRLKINSGTVAYTARYLNGVSFPQTTGTYLNITTGLDSGGTDDTVWWNIGNITVSGLNNVNLNSPIDNYNTSSRNVGFNFTVSVLSSNISTVDLWTNVTGVFNRTLRGDINASGVQEESPSVPGTITVETTGSYGMQLVTNAAFTIGNVTLFRNDNKTVCWLQNENGGITYKTANIINGQCELNYDLAGSSTYRIKLYSEGIMHNMTWNNAVTYPKTTTDGYFVWESGVDSSDASDAGSWYEIANVSIVSETGIIPSGVNNLTSLLNYTFTSDGNYIWGLRVCDVGGDCGFSENRTLTIDTIKPTTIIHYPTGPIPSLTIGQSLDLNYTAIDPHRQTCWREYNGANTTIASCANTTFSYVSGVNTIKVWANDSMGNINYTISTWEPQLIITGIQYNHETYETKNENITLNVTASADTQSLTARLWYNGTSYASTVTNVAANNYTLFNSITVPPIGTYANKSFFFELFQYNSTSSNTINSSTYWQNAALLNLSKCTSSFNVLALNFTAINEDTLARVTPFSFEGTINYWTGEGISYKNYSINDAAINETALCISPNITFYIDASIEYGDNNNTYITKDYNLNDFAISNVSQNISLYMIEADDSTTFILRVQDTAQNPEPNVYIHIQRYFPGTNTYETVQIAKTNDDGKTVGFYKAETVNYRHLLYDADGNLLLQTSPGKVFAESVPYTIIFTLGESPEVPWNDLETLDSLDSSIGYNNNTKIANFTYTDTSATFSSSRFIVEKVWYNQSNQVICNSTSLLAAAVINCNLANYNGSMIGYGYITRGTTETLVELYYFDATPQKGKDIFDKTGLFLAWLLMLVGASVFLYNFIAGMWVECAVILVVNLTGLASFPALFVWGTIALTIITTVVFGREGAV
jgi:hypothetical protein